MAVAIPALVGGAIGTGVAVSAGLVAAGSIGAAIAGGIGSMIVSSVVNGTNPFDDPAGAIASIAMGAMFSEAVQGLTAGEGVTINGVEAPAAVQGTAAATTLTNNLYDTTLSQAIGDGGLSFLSDIGHETLTESAFNVMDIADPSAFDSIAFNEAMADQAIVQSINKTLSVDAASSNFFNLDLESELSPMFTDTSVGGILADTNPATDERLSGIFFNRTGEMGSPEFGLDRQALQDYQNDRTFGRYDKEDPFKLKEESGASRKMPKLPSFGGPLTSAGSGFSLPPMPQAIQTLMGSATAQSGASGEGGFKDTQNRVVAPMIQSYQRQQERMSRIASQTWGIQQTSRFSGLLS